MSNLHQNYPKIVKIKKYYITDTISKPAYSPQSLQWAMKSLTVW